ncbi:hypothetical protein GCM10011581_43510 [Saccharopolyspora subtropica]|uniref:Uncharacterized protein n=1 Tax=Saccharopolyspora thermophila TaxID=89367 RepID=A0A917K6B0_9PSEU|nr:hypothetical protein [Saccharopolyspora subtropica]GGJ01597.1 hypothetical protein GCM10011581_43510 [Saccharopolyspora subtropica]
MKRNRNDQAAESVIQSAAGTVRVFIGDIDAREATFGVSRGVVNLNFGQAGTHVAVNGDITGGLSFS